MNVREVARLLTVSERMVRGLIAKPAASGERLPSHHIGSRVVFYPEEIRQWLAER
jgi:predicted DNA-binding transcriptional regulator AlpA